MSAQLCLLHSPLTGPEPWEPAAEVWRGRGRRTTVPVLTEALEGAGPYLPRLVAAAVAGASADGSPSQGVVLLAHSGAGALVPAVARALRGRRRVLGAVYVDAALTRPGRSWFATAPSELVAQLKELAGEGERLPPWDEWLPPDALAELLPGEEQRQRFRAGLPRVPVRYFEEPQPPEEPEVAGACAGYVRLSEAYAAEVEEARSRGATAVREFDGHHLSLYTAPETLVDLVEEVLGGLAVRE